jgi:hypothetical protein
MASKKTQAKRAVLPNLSEYAKCLTVVECDLGESLLVFEQRSENVHALNVTAKIIWATFNEDCTFDDLQAVLRCWFTRGVTKEIAVRAVASVFQELIKAKLLLPRNDPVAGFPVGQDVRINQSAKNVAFQQPKITTFTKEFLKLNHPGLAVKPTFRDTWGLANTTV